MRIVVLAEGDTERVTKDRFKQYLDGRAGSKPKVRLDIRPINGPITQASISVRASIHLEDPQTLCVIVLTDVYPRFVSAADAKTTVKSWMPKDARCHAHAAQFEFEAWLLPGWKSILERAGVGSRKPFGQDPETIDGERPPSKRIAELFSAGKKRYSKVIDGKYLFDKLDLDQAANQCQELRSFLDTMLLCAGY